jgi:hypothetical protein
MKEDLEKAVDLNLAARVTLVCSAHGIKDPLEINSKRESVKRDIMERITENHVGVERLSDLLDICIAKMESDLLQSMEEEKTTDIPVTKSAEPSRKKSSADRKHTSAETTQKKGSGYRPKSAALAEKLVSERKPIQTLLREDCVQIGLLKPQRAEYLANQFSGKLPYEAEEEVLVELRQNLHDHVRRIIRKLDGGGPWPTPKDQENLRLEIAEIPTVRSLLYLTRQILREREDWLDKHSITGRLFGHRFKF